MRREGVTGTLYLIPTPLGDTPLEWVLPEQTRRIAAGLEVLIVERAKTARAFLKRLDTDLPLQAIRLLELNEHTPADVLPRLLEPLFEGRDVGLLSEAGCPAVADPGSELVRLAHAQGIRVCPLVGPSAILLALMGSGLTGQRFAFHGYLPAKPTARRQALRALESRAEANDETQLFIETPYRSQTLFESILAVCRDDTWLAVACDLTLPTQSLLTRSIARWRERPPALQGRLCVFSIARTPAAAPSRSPTWSTPP
ncbi:MAG: SAM-dependent methyltransferase [Thiobacillaceae bacterium]